MCGVSVCVCVVWCVCVERDGVGVAVCAGSLTVASNTVQEEMRLITVYLQSSEEHRLGVSASMVMRKILERDRGWR